MPISSEDVLKQLSKGEVSSFKKFTPAITDGKRISNKVLRSLVGVLKKKNLTDDQILSKILQYDEWVELGKLNNDMLSKNIKIVNKQ